jgi:hypothetical protein
MRPPAPTPALAPAPAPIAIAIAAAVSIVVSVLPFFWSTTFFSDDHLFLTFARLAPSPLLPFVSDQHGGEFYRPIPWALWWVLGRLGSPPPTWPFALLGLALHATVAVEIAALMTALGRGRAAAVVAAALFFLSPATREAALWFVASPDLMATAAVLGSLIALVKGRAVASALLAAVAFFCKESAMALPLLALPVLAAREVRGGAQPGIWARRALSVVPHVVLAAGFFAVRWRVLGGLGGTGDERASIGVKLLQLASGFIHLVAGTDVVPEPLAWGLGLGALAMVVHAAIRAARRGDRGALIPIVFAGVASAPLLAAGWLVGARYFYLPAVGVAWLAGEALARGGEVPRAVAGLTLLALGALQTVERHDEVASYDRRVAAARRAVSDGVRAGHRVFHVVSGVKDIDLAVKEAPDLVPWQDRILVLGDVPASFAIMPAEADMADRATILVASPPLPPSGAYRFGALRVVGLARRGDDPTLDELLGRFPDTRFIRLRLTPGGHVIARDATDDVKTTLTAD